MSTRAEQVDLLDRILRNDEEAFRNEEENIETLEDDEDQLEIDRLRRRERNIGVFTGADNGIYEEYNR